MAGGVNSRDAYGVPIGVRAGIAEAADARPWEQPPRDTSTVQPRTRHVLVDIAGEWVEGLTIELRRDGDEWAVHVAYVLPGGVLHHEWLPMNRVRPLHPR